MKALALTIILTTFLTIDKVNGVKDYALEKCERPAKLTTPQLKGKLFEKPCDTITTEKPTFKTGYPTLGIDYQIQVRL